MQYSSIGGGGGGRHVYVKLFYTFLQKKIVYLKIPVGNKAHEDTKYNII